MESARQNAFSRAWYRVTDKIRLEMPQMWRLNAEKFPLTPKNVSRQPNEIFYRADSPASPAVIHLNMVDWAMQRRHRHEPLRARRASPLPTCRRVRANRHLLEYAKALGFAIAGAHDLLNVDIFEREQIKLTWIEGFVTQRKLAVP